MQSNYEIKIEKQKEKTEELYNKFKDLFGIDLSLKERTNKITEQRALFNYICSTLYGVNNSNIARFYKTKCKNFTPATVWHSLDKFEMYSNYNDSLWDMYYELQPEQIDKRKAEIELTEIQKSVTGLKKSEVAELLDLINLRKQSWGWKTKGK